jgi:hypothetical protein
MMRTVQLHQTTGDPALVGRSKGEAHLPRLAPLVQPPGAIVLDFEGIVSLSSSYFFTALWPFWAAEDSLGPSTFPVVANASAEIEEEIAVLLSERRMGAWRGKCAGGKFFPNDWLGKVDDLVLLAVRTAASTGTVTAVALSKVDNTKPTAWNNRLLVLHRQRMLRRHQSGRTQTYYPPWGEVDNG